MNTIAETRDVDVCATPGCRNASVHPRCLLCRRPELSPGVSPIGDIGDRDMDEQPPMEKIMTDTKKKPEPTPSEPPAHEPARIVDQPTSPARKIDRDRKGT
jgi:hypothetical protein